MHRDVELRQSVHISRARLVVFLMAAGCLVWTLTRGAGPVRLTITAGLFLVFGVLRVLARARRRSREVARGTQDREPPWIRAHRAPVGQSAAGRGPWLDRFSASSVRARPRSLRARVALSMAWSGGDSKWQPQTCDLAPRGVGSRYRSGAAGSRSRTGAC